METISSADIRIGDPNVAGIHPSKRDIAMVFQSYAHYPNMSVEKNIAFGMEIRRIPRKARKEAIQNVAEMLQIGDLLKRKPAQLSGGQRQRVAMGRALVRDPQVFLFDEPLSNLDAKLRVDMRTEIKRLHQRMGTTIVYVTHDQIEALTLATKIAVLKNGLLQQFGTPAEVYNDPANMFVADFMGSPSMNLIPAKIEDDLVVLKGGDKDIHLPGPHYLAPYTDVVFGIRPEALTDPDGADRAGRIEIRPCAIDVVEPAGSDTFAVTTLGGREATARLRADAVVDPGTVADMAFNLDKVVYVDPETGQRIRG